MKALVAELRAIESGKAPSAIVITVLARAHHQVGWNDQLHICVSLQLLLRHLELAQQFFAVFKDGLAVHAVEALREAEAEVGPGHCLEVSCAR